jgi:16S rRNA (cytosine1407-C5)-methyltransferase
MEKREQFITKLNNIFGETSKQVIEKISKPKEYFSFRINTLVSKVAPQIDASKGPFKDSYYLKNEDRNLISNDAGEFYIQSFSSMLAVQNLDIKSGDVLLDMCAAPGGKSAYAAALANNEINIVALDNNIARVHSMKDNFSTLGVKNFEIKKMDAARAQSDPSMVSRFDKIICDVPCSNEGLIRLTDNAFEYWNPKHSKHLPMLQKRILASAINCLKPNGVLVYSTCTFSPEENEEVIDWALEKFPEMTLARVESFSIPTIDGFTQWKKGKHTKNYNLALNLTKRVLPDDKFDGFYIAKLIRR